jgi:hypothetical protein
MKTFVLLILIPVATAFAAPRSLAQSCTTSTCAAASASESDFLAALPSSGNTNATVTVNIPSGSSTWAMGITYTIPSAITTLIIQGATTVNCTGAAGTSGYSCSATDNTLITDNYSSNTGLLLITTGAPSTSFRLTGITLTCSNSSYPKYNGCLQVEGSSQSVRIDHNDFITSTNAAMTQYDGTVQGVVDHNLWNLGNNSSVSNGVRVFTPLNDSIGYADGSWATSTTWGSSAGFYVESNEFIGGASDDCINGGQVTVRYNTINDAYLGVQNHSTSSGGAGWRGCRRLEIYHNYFEGPTGSPASQAVSVKGGTALIWGNNVASGYYLFEYTNDRNENTYTETPTPNGWGYCGTAMTGAGSNWDGDQPSIAQGYPCLDGVGRGYDAQALNGHYFPNRLNSVTGTVAWPQQYLEPVYVWMNTVYSGFNEGKIGDSVTKLNKDVYIDNTSFNGTTGTGFGQLSARPSTCTAGPGGSYYTSPTGSYGVAYWATDANSGNGELYVCTATNTWTAIYQPYTYPHPLTGGTATASVNPPTNLAATIE